MGDKETFEVKNWLYKWKDGVWTWKFGALEQIQNWALFAALDAMYNFKTAGTIFGI